MGQIRVGSSQVIDVLTKYLEADHVTADSKLVG
jgi:hypothetical protein